MKVAFREAAIEVAWGAEPLCDDTTEIEPFVLWSADGVRRGLSSDERKALKASVGMDEHWRIAWLDESTPDELKIGDVVVAVNGRELPGASLSLDVNAVWRGASPLSTDDQSFWKVMQQGRDDADDNETLTLTLADKRQVKVQTQRGCAGSVVASAFDNEPGVFWRDGTRRVKIPGNALMEAEGRDEFRWLAAFGTYFQSTADAIDSRKASDNVQGVFTIGQVFIAKVPGAGMILSALDRKVERTIAVDGIVGAADLFANEVVAKLGGDAGAGLAMNERFQAKKIPVDSIAMNDFRRSSVQMHVQELKLLQAEQERAEREQAEREEEDDAVGATAAATAAAAEK